MADFYYPLTLGIECPRPIRAENKPGDMPVRKTYEIWCEGVQRQEREYEELPADKVFEALCSQLSVAPGFWLIRGEPGAGKTTLLEDWFRRGASVGVPVLVRLREFGKSDWKLSAEALAELFWQRGCEELALLTEERIDCYRGDLPSQPVWLLDGLDEVTPPCLKRELYRKLANFPGRKVVTCRTAVYARLKAEADAYRIPERDYEVLGLRSAKEQRAFLSDYFHGDREHAEDLQHRIARHAPLRFLAGNPLMLSLIAQLSDRMELPATLAAFYREAVSRLWARKLDYGDPAEWLDNERDRLLTWLAQTMSVKQIEAERGLLMRCAREVADADAENLIAVLKKTGLLRIDNARGCYSFHHLTFQEYYLARSLQTEGLQATLEQHWDDPRYEETLSLLISLMAEAGEFEAIEQGLRWLIAWGAETHRRDPKILRNKGRSPLRTALHVWARAGIREREAEVVEKMLWSAVRVDEQRKFAVACDERSPPETLARLATDEDVRLRREVASNAAILEETLAQLATDGDAVVRRAVAWNVATPAKALTRLAADEAPVVRTAVVLRGRSSQWQTPDPFLAEAESWNAVIENDVRRVAVAINSVTSTEALARLAADENPWLLGMVVRNATVPAKTLAWLAANGEKSLRIEVASNAAILEETLAQLATDEDAEVRCEVARNATTPKKTLKRLAADEDAWVQSEVARNAATLLEDLGELQDFQGSLILTQKLASSAESVLEQFDKLNPPDKLAEIMLRLDMPHDDRPAESLSLRERKVEIIEWSKRKDGLAKLSKILESLIAGQNKS